MMLGLVGGTALESLALDDGRLHRVETRWGVPSSPLLRGNLAGTELCFINRHGADHSLPPHKVNYRANIAALADMGVDAILAVNAVGGIGAAMAPGCWVVPDQLVDYTWGRAHTFSDSGDDPLLHVDFTSPYDDRLRRALAGAALQAGVSVVEGGVFGITQGPRLETAAEIRRMERDGCDIVGMTGMPEAALAREAGIPYASLALVVNHAAGKGEGEITMAEIAAVMAAAAPALLRLLEVLCDQGWAGS